MVGLARRQVKGARALRPGGGCVGYRVAGGMLAGKVCPVKTSKARWIGVAAVAIGLHLPSPAASGQGLSPVGGGTLSATYVVSDRPEPMVYAVMRQLAVTPVGSKRLRLRATLQQWQSRHHDGAVNSGGAWLPANELKRRREVFARKLDEAEELLREIGRPSSDPRERLRQAQKRKQFIVKLKLAAAQWGDPVIRDFLMGQVALLDEKGAPALQKFGACIRKQPLVAGYYQGRSMAYALMNRPLDALADREKVFAMRDDNGLAYAALGEAMKGVPGALIGTPGYVSAKSLLAAYAPPERKPRSYSSSRGQAWDMPGGGWQGQKGSITVPAYDTLVVNKTVVVPVADAGVLLVDAKAVEGAGEMLLQVSPGKYVRAETARVSSRATKDLKMPLTAIRVAGYRFTPVLAAEAASVKKGDRLTLYAYSLPAEIAERAPRLASLRVTAVADGTITLDGQLLPGESTSPAFNAAGKLVTFLSGRIDPTVENGGPHVVSKPADVAAFVAAMAKAGGSRRSSYGRAYSPTHKDAPRPATGSVFTLHIFTPRGGRPKRR